MTHPHPPDLPEETLRLAISGDGASARAAMAKLYDRYAPEVRYGTVRAVLRMGYHQGADELEQAVWHWLLENDRRMLSFYRFGKGPMWAFIKMLAYQQAMRVIRKERRRRLVDAGQAVPGDDVADDQTSEFLAEMVQDDLFRKLMDRALEELDDLDLRLIRAVYFEGRKIRELAREWGINENTLFKRHERIKKKLRKWAEELLGPGKRPPAPMVAVLAVALAVQGMVDLGAVS